jgi:hypothetical protein
MKNVKSIYINDKDAVEAANQIAKAEGRYVHDAVKRLLIKTAEKLKGKVKNVQEH